MSEHFDAFVLRLALDTVIPLRDGTYRISREGVANLSLKVTNFFSDRKQVGSFEAHGNVRVHHSNGTGRSDVELTYSCGAASTLEAFAEALSISPIWHMSATGWDFVLEDINRIIDLYRYLANAYWWQHLSMWNVDELRIYGRRGPDGQLSFVSQSSSPKQISFAGNHFADMAYDRNSAYVTHIQKGTKLPLYFLMYLNGRRSFVEHAYREALVNWANCVEAYSVYLLLGACKLAKVSENEERIVLDSANEYKKRYSKYVRNSSRRQNIPFCKKEARNEVD